MFGSVTVVEITVSWPLGTLPKKDSFTLRSCSVDGIEKLGWIKTGTHYFYYGLSTMSLRR